MSLDTILKIGKQLRSAEDSLKNFKYVNPCPKQKGEFIDSCFSIPISGDFKINWNGINKISENEKDKLFYLRFKTSDSDSLVKYIFGDVYFSKSAKLTKAGNIQKAEGGYYRLGNPESIPAFRKSSFGRGESDFENIVKSYKGEVLTDFRKGIENDLAIFEKILNNISAVEQFVFEDHELSFLSFLENTSEIKNAAIKRIFEKASIQNLKKWGINSEFPELTEEEKNRILEFDSGDIFIHFEFPGSKHWYEFEDEFELISKQMLADFVEDSDEGLVLKKTLYKTLCSGDKKNDWQFPSFQPEGKYKSKAFTNEEVQDLFYAIDYSSRGRIISGTDIKIILLPKGENLKAEDFEEFVQKRYDENRIKERNQTQNEDSDPMFDIFEKDDEDDITSFDVIFCKKGGSSSPDVDLLEISGIEKSKIKSTRQRIEDIANEVGKRRKSFLRTEKELFKLKLEYSLRSILGNPQADFKTGKVSFKANPKYQSHILKILPFIYTDSYHHDDILLIAFLQNVEYSIRAGDNKFNLLKFDLEFLLKIQNSQINKFMEITNSSSYQIGLLLGGLAKNLSLEIKSFEKNYVGNLTRRISSIDDFIKLKNDIEQKLIMHDKSKFTFKDSYELAQKVKTFEGRYDKEECVFGFFESYFKPLPKKENTDEQ